MSNHLPDAASERGRAVPSRFAAPLLLGSLLLAGWCILVLTAVQALAADEPLKLADLIREVGRPDMSRY